VTGANEVPPRREPTVEKFPPVADAAIRPRLMYRPSRPSHFSRTLPFTGGQAGGLPPVRSRLCLSRISPSRPGSEFLSYRSLRQVVGLPACFFKAFELWVVPYCKTKGPECPKSNPGEPSTGDRETSHGQSMTYCSSEIESSPKRYTTQPATCTATVAYSLFQTIQIPLYHRMPGIPTKSAPAKRRRHQVAADF